MRYGGSKRVGKSSASTRSTSTVSNQFGKWNRKRGEVFAITQEQWNEIVRQWGGRCAHCGVKFNRRVKCTMDRIIPGSAGGLYVAGNVVPACLKCNTSRGAKDIEEYREWRLKKGLRVR